MSILLTLDKATIEKSTSLIFVRLFTVREFMKMRRFISCKLIFNFFTALILKHQSCLCSFSLESGNGNGPNSFSLESNVNPWLDFVKTIYSKSTFIFEASLLNELEVLQKAFTGCNNSEQKLFIANKATGLLLQLARSEKILKDKNLCFKFQCFLIKTLLKFEFNEEDVKNFVLGLDLDNSKYRLYLKGKSLCWRGVKVLGFLGLLICAFGNFLSVFLRLSKFVQKPNKDNSPLEYFKEFCMNFFGCAPKENVVPAIMPEVK